MSIGQPSFLCIRMFVSRYKFDDTSYATEKRLMVLRNTNCSTLSLLSVTKSVFAFLSSPYDNDCSFSHFKIRSKMQTGFRIGVNKKECHILTGTDSYNDLI